MPDPLLCDYPLPHHRRFYPLGFPLDVFTNSEAVLEAAQQSWGLFPQTCDRPPRVLRIGVTEDEVGPVPTPPVYRGHRNVVSIVSDAANYTICELDKGFAYSWVTSSLVRETASLRYFFLEASAYVLIVSAYLAGVHSACVEWQGKGVLLAGESGAGKSSMAYACARAGWTYISDDASYLMRDSDSLEIIGNPFSIRLRESAASLFPEFAGSAITSHPYGKKTIEVPTFALGDLKTSCRSKVHTVVFLKRNGVASPVLTPFPKEEALRIWSEGICFGDECVRAEHYRAFSRLSAVDTYELKYAEASTAIRYLETFLSGGK
jgi:hypothetical protein